jgi:hypothetical protein
MFDKSSVKTLLNFCGMSRGVVWTSSILYGRHFLAKKKITYYKIQITNNPIWLKNPRFHVLKINLEHLKEVEEVSSVIMSIAKTIGEGLGKDITNIDTREKFQGIFRKEMFEKPLILDEFDALEEKVGRDQYYVRFSSPFVQKCLFYYFSNQIFDYLGQLIHPLELKSFKDMYRFEKSIDQAAEYGWQMGLKEIFLLEFVELSEEDAKQLEQEVDKSGIKVIVLPVAIL